MRLPSVSVLYLHYANSDLYNLKPIRVEYLATGCVFFTSYEQK